MYEKNYLYNVIDSKEQIKYKDLVYMFTHLIGGILYDTFSDIGQERVYTLNRSNIMIINSVYICNNEDYLALLGS